MALLRQLVSRKGLPIKPALLYNSSRSAARVLSDYMPGPYPKTEKERLEAAKKYGLLPEEYEPTPDDGWGRGDYPRLPEIGADSKDPWYPWDLPEYRKNFGEVWHIDSDMLGEDRVDPQKDWWVDKRVMVGMLVGVIGTFWTIAMLTDPYPVHRPVSVKQIPGKESGKVYYTFEKSN